MCMRFRHYITAFITLFLIGCSDFTEPQSKDISLFNDFLKQTEVINNSIHVESTYDKKSKLFKPVLAIQRKKLAEAEEDLKPLVEKGDPEAMFWMAKIIYRSSINDTPKALNLLQKAAENNPYAAMALFPDNRECQRYFNGFCEDKWIDKAKKLFIEQSKNGDVRAEFYIEKLKRKHDVYISAIINAAENNYLYPMVEYAEKVLLNSNSSSDMKKMAISLLRYGRERQFIPAIDMLMGVEIQSGNKNTEEFNTLFSEAINLGSNAAWEMMGISAIKDQSNSNINKYTIAKAIYDFSGDEFALAFTKPIENKKDLAIANKKAQEMVDAVEDVIYIDGAHPRQD